MNKQFLPRILFLEIVISWCFLGEVLRGESIKNSHLLNISAAQHVQLKPFSLENKIRGFYEKIPKFGEIFLNDKVLLGKKLLNYARNSLFLLIKVIRISTLEFTPGFSNALILL